MAEYTEADRERLGAFVKRSRLAAGHVDIKGWAKLIERSTRVALGLERGESEIGPKTYASVEKALGWPAGACFRILAGDDPDATVGGSPQTAEQFVESPGGSVDSRITNEDLYREILRSRAEYDQLRAEQREVAEQLRDLSERVARVEQPDS